VVVSFDSIPHDKLMGCVRMRVVDRSVLKLIRMWLETPVVEPGEEGKPERWSRPRKGSPQGGVISPLLSNVYLHWFDKLFHRADGPAQWAGAKLVRYADDFVVLARYQGTPLTGWIESKLEGWLGLEINREKTRVVNLKEEGANLDFLGFTFRYYEDLKGRGWQYLNVSPSAKALKKEREKLHEMTDQRQCTKPIPQLIEEFEPASERLEELLRLWVSTPSLPRDQLVRSLPSHAASETAQSTALSSAGRGQFL
jgi:RNA-directed DNA polymerase